MISGASAKKTTNSVAQSDASNTSSSADDVTSILQGIHYIQNQLKELLDSFPPSLYELEMNSQWDPSSRYKSKAFSGVHSDYHPNTTRYCNYLIKIGLPITDEAIQYAEESTKSIQQVKNRDDFTTIFPYCHDHRIPGIW